MGKISEIMLLKQPEQSALAEGNVGSYRKELCKNRLFI